MTGAIIDLVREALWTVIIVAMPMLGCGLAVGLTVSIFQTVTSIQEPTLAFVPKIIAVFVAIIVFGPWMITTLTEFINRIFTSFNYYIR